MRFAVLHPQADDYLRPAPKPNTLSCALARDDARGQSVLLSGDLEAEQELRLVHGGQASPLASQVLVVPHHGSNTSSTPEFIAAVAPQVAFVQAGYRNRFGHPAAGAIDGRRHPRPIRARARQHVRTLPAAAAGGHQCAGFPCAGSLECTQRRLQGLRLLVAEDNPVNQIIIKAALSMEGAAVTVVDDGQQAVGRVRSDGGSGFDLALMDLQMPLMDGYAATRHIREIAPRLPVVGQTAHAMAEERDRWFAAGMVAHVAKPIDLELLVATVQQHALRPER